MTTEDREREERNDRIEEMYRATMPIAQIARREKVSATVVTKVLRRRNLVMGWPEFAKARGYHSSWK